MSSPAPDPPARPAMGLRIVGFLAVAFGALATGVGATREWASIGFVADVEGAADVPLNGTDVWEGKTILLLAAVALVALFWMRVSGSATTRSALAGLLIALGAVCLSLPLVDAARAEDRFGGGEGADVVAERLAAQLGLPEEVIREQLQEQLERDLRVDLEPGLWLAAAGGVLLGVGGVLGLAWVRRGAAPRGEPGAV